MVDDGTSVFMAVQSKIAQNRIASTLHTADSRRYDRISVRTRSLLGEDRLKRRTTNHPFQTSALSSRRLMAASCSVPSLALRDFITVIV